MLNFDPVRVRKEGRGERERVVEEEREREKERKRERERGREGGRGAGMCSQYSGCFPFTNHFLVDERQSILNSPISQ